MSTLAFFDNWGPTKWAFLTAAAVLYLIMTVRVAGQMARIGRSPVRWFFISLFFTAIPSSIVLLHHRFAWLTDKDAPPPDVASNPPIETCPHCGELVDPDVAPGPSGVKTCPHCRQVVDEAHLA